MPLPPATDRTPIHERDVIFRGFQRADGLWDIEAELRDAKATAIAIPNSRNWAPGETIHGMSIRLTVDDDTVVHAIEVAMDHVPHGPCPLAAAPMQRMVGSRLNRGWRRSIEQHLGGLQGCAHLRELLFNMATVAFQTMVHRITPADPDQPPAHLGKCVAWDFDGPVVEKYYPKFFRLEVDKG